MTLDCVRATSWTLYKSTGNSETVCAAGINKTGNVTLRRVRVATIAVEKQEVW